MNIPHNSKPKITVLTRDQQYLLIRASYQHRYGAFIRLDLMTGLRLGELLGLRWIDIDFRASVRNRQTYWRKKKGALQNTPAKSEG